MMCLPKTACSLWAPSVRCVIRHDSTPWQTAVHFWTRPLLIWQIWHGKYIVVLITHAPNKLTNPIKAIKQASIVCTKTDKEEPLYFRFNHVHCEKFDDDEIWDGDKLAWDLLNTTMKDFLAFINESQSVSLKMTEKTQTSDSIHLQYKGSNHNGRPQTK